MVSFHRAGAWQVQGAGWVQEWPSGHPTPSPLLPFLLFLSHLLTPNSLKIADVSDTDLMGRNPSREKCLWDVEKHQLLLTSEQTLGRGWTCLHQASPCKAEARGVWLTRQLPGARIPSPQQPTLLGNRPQGKPNCSSYEEGGSPLLTFFWPTNRLL